MTLESLIRLVSKHYPDNYILAHWNSDTQKPRANSSEGRNDTLALFLVRELYDTYDDAADDKAQLATALHAVKRAENELATVRRGLDEAHKKAKSKIIQFPKKKP